MAKDSDPVTDNFTVAFNDFMKMVRDLRSDRSILILNMQEIAAMGGIAGTVARRTLSQMASCKDTEPLFWGSPEIQEACHA